jgi:hypothetical protein
VVAISLLVIRQPTAILFQLPAHDIQFQSQLVSARLIAGVQKRFNLRSEHRLADLVVLQPGLGLPDRLAMMPGSVVVVLQLGLQLLRLLALAFRGTTGPEAFAKVEHLLFDLVEEFLKTHRLSSMR